MEGLAQYRTYCRLGQLAHMMETVLVIFALIVSALLDQFQMVELVQQTGTVPTIAA